MKYLKNWSLYLEDFEINVTDTSDIKKAKEKLNTLRNQIDEFNKKYMEINLENDLIVKGLIEFLEYEEAYTKDKETAERIRTLLTNLGIWKD